LKDELIEVTVGFPLGVTCENDSERSNDDSVSIFCLQTWI